MAQTPPEGADRMTNMADRWDDDDERGELRLLREIKGAIEVLINTVISGDQAIIAALKHPTTLPTAAQVVQIDKKGNKQMAITGIAAGGTGTFEADAILNGVADPDGFPAGSVDTWTTDDALVTLGPDIGPNGSQVVASVAATDTAADFGLTVSVQMPAVAGVAPAPLVNTVRVPITAAPPPVPTGVVINQVA